MVLPPAHPGFPQHQFRRFLLLTNALDPMQPPDPVIQVKGLCKICGQSVWNNEERFKTCGEDGVYEVCVAPLLSLCTNGSFRLTQL